MMGRHDVGDDEPVTLAEACRLFFGGRHAPRRSPRPSGESENDSNARHNLCEPLSVAIKVV
jgi:hypothetical protein